MTVHSLAPGFLLFKYTSNSHQHVQTLPVDPVAIYNPGDSVLLRTFASSSVSLATAAGNWVNAVKALFHTSTTFNSMEYWQKPNVDSDPLFIESSTIVAGAGTSATATNANSQIAVTFRTTLGGILRIALMETYPASNTEWLPPTWGGFTNLDTLTDFILGADNFVKGRDFGWPQTALRALSKTNDALRKRYLLG